MAALNPRLADLSDDDRQVLESWLVEFDQRWDEGLLANRLDQIPPGSSWRLPALAEMVKIDLERQWRRGRQVSLESYLEEFPELGSPGDVSIDLIQVEYEVRCQFGAPLTLEDYLRRFPHQAGELARLIPQDGSGLSRNSSVAAPSRSSPRVQKSAKTPEQLPEQLGRYRIIKRLGQGGMGSVYLAQDSHLERPVALKVPDFGNHEAPDARRRFLEEARTAATLDHPYLCPVYDAGEIDGQPYLTMAYIEGQSLAALIGDEGWPKHQVAALVGKHALALHEAHTRKVIHRDLKPANVMIKTTSGRREPVIVDFGLARRDNPQDQRLTRSGQIIGTLGYMAPEQIRGDLTEIGPACDIYALGVILYELLTGRLPFSGSQLGVAAQILTQAPLPPSTYRSDLNPVLEAICLKAMSKTVGDRYASMAELAAALTGFLQSSSASPMAAAASGSPTSPSPALGERPQPAGSDSLVGHFLAQLAENQASPSPILTPEPVALRAPLPERRRPPRPLIVAVGVLSLIVLFAIIYVVTDKGRIKITVDGPTLAIKVDGNEVRIDGLGEPITLRSGEHDLTVVRGTTETETRKFIVRRGQDEALRIEYVPQIEKSASTKKDAEPNSVEKMKSADTENVAKSNPLPEAPTPAGQALPVQEAKKSSVPEPDPEAPTVGYQLLFNGKDLTGWKTHPSQPENWRVEHGILIGSGPAPISHLYTNHGDFKDFHLRAEVRINDGGNGGVYARASFGPVWPVQSLKYPYGYEAQVQGGGTASGNTGSLFLGSNRPVADVRDPPVPASQWIKLDVRAEGNRVVVMVNDKITADFTDPERHFLKGHIALQKLYPETVVEFRKIEIKELKGTAQGTDGLQAGPAQTKVGGKPAAHAAIPSKRAQKRAAKASLPLTRLVRVREFNGPRDVSLENAPHGRSDGVYFVESPGGFHAWNMDNIRSAGTLDVVARLLSEDPRKTGAWMVIVLGNPAPRGFLIKINVKGELFLEPNPWPAAKAFLQIDPRIGPIVHPAIKPGFEFNKLLLVMGKREVVILVNGVQVCAPVWFDYDVTPCLLELGAVGPGNKRAEFDRIEIREMVQPEDAPAKAKATSPASAKAVKGADLPKPGPMVPDESRKHFINTIGMKLTLILAGDFLMGSPDSDPSSVSDEKPPHRVQISKPFYLGIHEVTQGQYRAVMGDNPSHFKGSGDLPVDMVSWLEAVQFCIKLSELENRTPCYRIDRTEVTVVGGNGYRLPTEAEWEYACRAGSTTVYPFSDDVGKLAEHAWYEKNSDGKSHSVGMLSPNALGIHDMLGNVWEWCGDRYDKSYYASSPGSDPSGAPSAPARVRRGGAWSSPPRNSRAACRNKVAPGHKDGSLGFRLVLAQSQR